MLSIVTGQAAVKYRNTEAVEKVTEYSCIFAVAQFTCHVSRWQKHIIHSIYISILADDCQLILGEISGINLTVNKLITIDKDIAFSIFFCSISTFLEQKVNIRNTYSISFKIIIEEMHHGWRCRCKKKGIFILCKKFPILVICRP